MGKFLNIFTLFFFQILTTSQILADESISQKPEISERYIVSSQSLSYDLAQLYHRDSDYTSSPQSSMNGAKIIDSHTPTLRVVVALAWEGRDLSKENLEAIDKLRQMFPKLRIMHFISPAYFLRDPTQGAKAASTIKSRILADDSVGLLLNGWKSVVTAANVTFRSYPTFWGSTLRDIDCKIDCGVDVPINVYPALDLQKIIALGADTLESQGFGKPIAIQTGGWVASPQVLESAIHAGMRYDFSAIPLAAVAHRIRLFPLHDWVKNLWQDVTPSTGPYEIRVANAQITQVPLNLGIVDYLSSKTSIKNIDNWLKIAKQRQSYGPPVTATIGLYQETADLTLGMSTFVLDALLTSAQAAKVNIEAAVLPDTIASAVPQQLAADGTDSLSQPRAADAQVTNPENASLPAPKPNRSLREPPRAH